MFLGNSKLAFLSFIQISKYHVPYKLRNIFDFQLHINRWVKNQIMFREYTLYDLNTFKLI